MIFDRNKLIADRFGAKASEYDENAGLQARVAAELASFLPDIKSEKVLEIGCGTGLFTEHLIGHYPDAEIHAIDLSQDMLDICRRKIGFHKNIHFTCCDAETLGLNGSQKFFDFNVIATSMTIQWFSDPVSLLERLKLLLAKSGKIYYATIGPKIFPEWNELLHRAGLPSGTIQVPDLPGQLSEEFITIPYESSYHFLKNIKGLGASISREGYTGLSVTQLRKLLREEDANEGICHFTWHIVYGELSADNL